MQKIVIGITGRIRAGKETAAKAIASIYDVDEFASSDALYETLRLFGVPVMRKNTQSLSTFVRSTFADTALSCPLVQRVEKSKKHLCIISSIRRESDFSELRKRFPFFLLFIDTPIERRYERFLRAVKDRGDEGMTFDEFLVRDAAETETQIDQLKSTAECVISNVSSIEDLSERVLECVRQKINTVRSQ